jgi:hypothetical protein
MEDEVSSAILMSKQPHFQKVLLQLLNMDPERAAKIAPSAESISI